MQPSTWCKVWVWLFIAGNEKACLCPAPCSPDLNHWKLQKTSAAFFSRCLIYYVAASRIGNKKFSVTKLRQTVFQQSNLPHMGPNESVKANVPSYQHREKIPCGLLEWRPWTSELSSATAHCLRTGSQRAQPGWSQRGGKKWDWEEAKSGIGTVRELFVFPLLGMPEVSICLQFGEGEIPRG